MKNEYTMKKETNTINEQTDIRIIVGKEGFIDCYKNQTLFLTPEGKKKLGVSDYMQETKSSQTAG